MKTIDITGIVYDQQRESLIDYGFGKLYSHSHKLNASTHTFSIEDNSICPPMYEEQAAEPLVEFKQNGEYKAVITKINESKSWVELRINDIEPNHLNKHIIYINNLAKYWGSIDCLHKNYKIGDSIDVKFLQTKYGTNNRSISIFCEKGVRIVQFAALAYRVGDILSAQVGPTDGRRQLAWFNGTTVQVLPYDDIVFARRVSNKIYYPGYPIKAEVCSIISPTETSRFYKFKVLHEYADYGLKEGDYPCVISSDKWKREIAITVNCDNQERTYLFEMPFTDLPTGLSNKKKAQATARICGFDKIGEPQIQIIPNAEMKDEIFESIKKGDIESVTIVEKHEKYCKVIIKNRKAILINYACTDDEIQSLDAIVTFIDGSSKLILCTPVGAEQTAQHDIPADSQISLPIIAILKKFAICGDGVHTGIMNLDNWDWFSGKTLTSDYDSSLYTKMIVKEVTEEGILVLSRRELLENPWEKATITAGQRVDVTFIEINERYARVRVDNIIADAPWKDLCPYDISYSPYLFMKGETVQMIVKHIDTGKRAISFAYPPEKAIPTDISFRKDEKLSATVVRDTDKGVVIKVNDIYGAVKLNSRLIGHEYAENQTIDVKFSYHFNSTYTRYFGFIHVATVDASDIFKYKNVLEAKLETIMEDWLEFSASGHKIFCHKTCAKYFSAEREDHFADSMQPGQTFTLRITDPEKRRGVPNAMPDYSTVQPKTEYAARIHEIGENGYHLYVDKFNDIFYVPFAKYCDWGESHIETRQVNDEVKTNVVSYIPEENRLIFSLLDLNKDPWESINQNDTIKVKCIGSILKKDDFYVSVNGVAVKLSNAAICGLLKSPWIGNNILYTSLEKLEEENEFEMDVIDINKTAHTIILMPHVGEIPKFIRNEQIIRKNGSVWIRNNRFVGLLPAEEIPEGFELGNILDQAICKSYDRANGYVILSIKDLYGEADIVVNEKPEQESGPQGIHVTEDTELEEGLIVRGKVNNINHKNGLIYVNVGPYLGIIKYNELSNIICDAPKFALHVGKEYDFSVSGIRKNDKGTLMQLTRKPLQPVPPKDIPIGEIVYATVQRHCDGVIVAALNEYNGLEAVISSRNLAGCEFNNQIRYPARGFTFRAKIAEVLRSQAGNIIRITLTEGE